MTDRLYVGGSGGLEPALGTSGVLTVNDGGSLNSTNAFVIGSDAGSTGFVEVEGQGSTLIHDGDLVIGDQGGTGTLKFFEQGQGSVKDGLWLGNTVGSDGTLIIDGAQSTLEAASLGVGIGGTGTGTINNGGVFTTDLLVIANNTGSTGTMTITDAGSGVAINGDAIVGNSGTGMLSILAGATMIDKNAYIGFDANDGMGTVTVDGTGSIWNTSATLAIGDNATGTLNVQNGGKVASVSGEIGFDTTGIGTVNVTGPGSTWKSTTIDDGDFGNGTMTISGGGAVTASTFLIGAQAGSTGALSVTGSGSSLTSSGFLTVGNNGAGTMTIVDGGTVVDDVGDLGTQATANATVKIDGAGSTWTNTALIVGDNGTATLKISDGAAVTADTGLVAYQPNSSGTITVDGAGSILTFGNSLALGRFGAGTLTVSNGATLKSLPGVMLGLNTGAAGVLNIGADGASAAATPGTVNAPLIAFGDGAGTINFNHTSQNYTFIPGLAGLGTINQIAGVTHLAADSSGFNGTSNVTGGTLFIDTNLGAGQVNVQSGGSVGGTGKTAGAVNIFGDGTLIGVEGQTFTMHDLSLGGASNVNVTLDTPGGAALFKVNDSLELDGTLNISSPGAFGPGVYALMTYGGTLTDNGLDIGATPTGTSASDFSVQTSVAGQVNLVDVKPLDRVFWDGDGAGSTNNNAVDGGSGVWSATNTNWTDVNGGTNGAMVPQPGFAIFQNTSGTVTVDASAGPIEVTGMQFASDGYDIVGDVIALADPDTIIRVGDGSAAGADYITKIASVLTGSGGLDKTDLGTLILTGTNNYTGGTTITGGALQIGDGSVGGFASVVGGIVDNDQLVFDNQADLGDTSNNISGTGSVRVSGTTIFTGTGTYTGGTAIDANGRFYIGSNGTIGSIAGDVANSGELAFNRSDDLSFDGIISGTGLVLQNGAGRIILTGVNTYTGETHMLGGDDRAGGRRLDRGIQPARGRPGRNLRHFGDQCRRLAHHIGRRRKFGAGRADADANQCQQSV